MDLLIDIGNTRVKWAQLNDGGLGKPGDVAHRGRDLSVIESALGSCPRPDRVRVANVAGPEFEQTIEKIIATLWRVPVDFARSQPAAGTVRNAYDDYRQLGVDRWLTLLATYERYQCPACIIDAGTALTIDVLHEAGEHQGGYIVPGVELMMRSLHADTGDLARLTNDGLPLAGAATDFGRDTGSAIANGALAMLCRLIDHCVAELRGRHRAARIVLTGGDAERLEPYLRGRTEIRPHLVLEGLALYSPGDQSPGRGNDVA